MVRQLSNLKDNITVTRLEGISKFLVDGIMNGEFDSNTTVSELMSKVEQLKEDKLAQYKKRMRDVKAMGIEDDIFR